jgi:hypothetical protein
MKLQVLTPTSPTGRGLTLKLAPIGLFGKAAVFRHSANRLLSIVLVIRIAAPAIAVQAKDALVLKTVNVVLPTSDRIFPDGPGSDVVNSYCLVCHSVAMVLSQSALTRSAGKRKSYKAPIPEDQIQTIASYLAGLQNPK